MSNTLYEILGVSQRAPQQKIEAAYSALISKYQDAYDKGNQSAEVELFKIKEAYNVLSNPTKRDDYDEKLARMLFQPETKSSVHNQSNTPSKETTLWEEKVPEPLPTALVNCKVCGQPISRTAKTCPHCGEDNYKPEVLSGNLPLMVGTAGSIVLFLGVFMPVVSIPIAGSMNYFRNGEGDGVIILILAAISLYLTLTKNFKRLWLTGIGSFAVLAFTFIHFQIIMHDIKKNMNAKLADNPFRGLADAAVEAIQLQWGWAVLVLGASMLIAAAVIAKTGR